MTDFETGAELSLTVTDRELRRVRGKVESALAEIEVGVDAALGGTGAPAGAGAGPSRHDRRMLSQAREQTAYAELQTEYLEEIEDNTDDGGGVAGSGTASNIFAELVGAGAETVGDVGVEVGDEITDVLKDTLSTALGNAVSGVFAGALGGGGGETSQPVNIEQTFEPNFNPDFNPNFNPEFSPTFNPEFTPTVENDVSVSPEFDFPDLNLGGEGPEILNPHPVEITNTPVDVSPIGVNVTVNGSGGGGGGGNAGASGRTDVGRVLDAGARGASTGFIGGGIIGGATTGGIGAIPAALLGGTAGGLLGGTIEAGQIARERLNSQGTQRNQSAGGGPAQSVNVTATTGTTNVTINTNVESAVNEAIRDLRRERERELEELRRDLESEIEGLRSTLRRAG